MATSLRDIPGAKRSTGRRRPRDSWQSFGRGATVLVDPRQSLGRTAVGRRRRSGLFDPRRPRLSRFDSLLVAGVVAVAVFLLWGLWRTTRVEVTSTGLERHDALTFGAARNLDVHITVRPAKTLPSATLTLDGVSLDAAQRLDDGFHWQRGDQPLTPGVHHLTLRVPRPVLPQSHFTWTFLVDDLPPRVDAPRVLRPHRMDQPVHLSGRVDTDADLTADGQPVKLDHQGRFSLDYEAPPAGPIVLRASDAAGHKVTHEVFVPIKRPRVHGVHMSAIAWRTRELRKGVLDLIREHKINTVELDLKDESGDVGYDSKVPLAAQIGAVRNYYDLKAAVAELHRRGVRVIGRVVVFRDPILANAAWADGHRDWVVQRPDGSPLGAYGGFTNMAARPVQEYNLDIAAEAANAGVDEVLWDYIRRPEGDLAKMVFPGMRSTNRGVRQGVVSFLTRGHQLLRAKHVLQGASLFGIASLRPDAVGQNVTLIAKHVDYIAPMVYPSLWVAGEHHVPDPVHMPYTIVVRSLEDFQQKSADTGVTFTPWLQDFSLGATYGDGEVRAQIDAANAVGIHDWLLWSPRVRYHAGRL